MAHLPSPALSRAASSPPAAPRPARSSSARAAVATTTSEPEPARPPRRPPASALVLAAYLAGPLLADRVKSRVAFGLADSQGLLTCDDTPEELAVSLVAPGRTALGEPITVARHAEGPAAGLLPAAVTARRARHLHRARRGRGPTGRRDGLPGQGRRAGHAS